MSHYVRLATAVLATLVSIGCSLMHMQPANPNSHAPKPAGKTMMDQDKESRLMYEDLLSNLQSFELPNGLKVAMLERNFGSVVAIQVWIKAGSAMERKSEAGIAHLIEHMVFKGSKKFPNGDITARIERLGGDVNAWTSFEQTVYHATVGSRFVPEVLPMLADMVTEPLFDAKELESEKQVVIEEIRRGKDNPEVVAEEKLFELAFGDHPYAHPIIGTSQSVSSLTAKQLESFHERFYAPDNAVLVLVGNFDPQQMRKEILSSFSHWQRKRNWQVEYASNPKPPFSWERFAVLREPIHEPQLQLSFVGTSASDENLPLLDLAGIVLAQSESSRLARNVERRLGLITGAMAAPFAGVRSGTFLVEATPVSGKEKQAIKAIASELFALAQSGIGRDELQAAKRIAEAETLYHYETVQSVASRIGYSMCVSGRPNFELEYLNRMLTATTAEVSSALASLLVPERMSAVLLLPEDSSTKLDAETLSTMLKSAANQPKPTYKPTSLRFGIQRAVLDNGLTVLVYETHNQPVVAIRAATLAGVRMETKENNGINNLIARMLTLGTSRLSADEIAQRLDRMGATMEGFSGRNTLGMKGNFLASNFEEGAELFFECLFGSTYPAQELERERQMVMEEIKAKQDSPSRVAFELMAQGLYGKHPYSMPTEGTLTSVSALDSSDLAEYAQRFLSPDKTVITIVGDVNAEAAIALIDKLAGSHPAFPTKLRKPAPVLPLEADKLLHKHLPRQQTYVVMGFLGPRFTDEDRFAATLLNAVLGSSGGRLFVNLRDRQGLAYSVGSVITEGIEQGHLALYVGTSPQNATRALDALKQEIARLLDEGIGEDELLHAKRYVVGSHEVALQGSGAIAMSILLSQLYEHDPTAPFVFADRIYAQDMQAVLRTAKKILSAHAAIAIVGPRQKAKQAPPVAEQR